MIDWENLAKLNGLTNEQFEKEVFMAAAALGAKRIDERRTAGEALKFTCSDEIGTICLLVKRIDS